MDIFINERSFAGHVQQHNELDLMRQFDATLYLLRLICPDGEVVVHSSFASRKITNDTTVYAWLSREDDGEVLNEGEPLAEEQGDAPNFQQLINLLLVALSNGPYVEDFLAEHGQHACYFQNVDHDWSSIVASAYLGGVTVSLGGQMTYVDGPLTIKLSRDGEDFRDTDVWHFVSPIEARKCRRRYVPNPKHHPNVAKPPHSKMELDRDYDPFDVQQELKLRHPGDDMPATFVQKLLDGAIAGKGAKQLYALDQRGRRETFYEFQPDNPGLPSCCFHGYPVPETEVPAQVVRLLRQHANERSD